MERSCEKGEVVVVMGIIREVGVWLLVFVVWSWRDLFLDNDYDYIK